MNEEIMKFITDNSKYLVGAFVLGLCTLALLFITGFCFLDMHDKNVKRIEKLEEDLRLQSTRSEYLESFIRRYIDFGVCVRLEDIDNKRSDKK